ncbi:MAG: type II secretion system protein F [Legionellales bacterium]|nr:type II secretion system protein F [Legionellales bacterium]
MAKNKQTVFDWEGKTQSGAVVSGKMPATNANIVRAELRRQGIIAKKVKKHTEPLFSFLRKNKIQAADIAIFTRQLSTMIGAGIPIVQSLEILAQGQENEKFQILLNNIKQDVESGNRLSVALSKYPKYFNPLICNLIDAGEQSGSLDIMLDKIAAYREKIESLKGKIKKALFYPTAVIVIAALISSGMLIFIVPQFAEIFKSFGADLPAATLMVIKISEFMQSYWYVILGAIVAIFFAIKKGREKSTTFAYRLYKYFLKIVVIGPILKKAAIARITQTLSITFAAGMPLIEALQVVAGSAGNLLYTEALTRVKDDVTSGQSVHAAMHGEPLFPAMVIQMIAVGEESGTLEFMLSKIADFYNEQVDNAVNSLSSLLEPVIMVVLGVVIGGLVVAMYLPIFRLGGVVSG